jgi:hypothetical protein
MAGAVAGAEPKGTIRDPGAWRCRLVETAAIAQALMLRFDDPRRHRPHQLQPLPSPFFFSSVPGTPSSHAFRPTYETQIFIRDPRKKARKLSSSPISRANGSGPDKCSCVRRLAFGLPSHHGEQGHCRPQRMGVTGFYPSATSTAFALAFELQATVLSVPVSRCGE